MSDHQYSEFATAEITATGQIGSFGVDRPLYLHKIFVRLAATSPTITLRNGGALGETRLNVWIVAAGDIIDVNMYFPSGCHYTEVGAITATFWYR